MVVVDPLTDDLDTRCTLEVSRYPSVEHCVAAPDLFSLSLFANLVAGQDDDPPVHP
jgi:hypothetical protein